MNSKVALVTGGTRGLGAAIAVALRDAGYCVAAVHRSNADAAQAFKEKRPFRYFAGMSAISQRALKASGKLKMKSGRLMC